ncbi:MAG: 4Fe-4S binding protein [Gammaproteobacteria bacterium]|jgi:NosR/NirI family nitrous oxide reductase transcriptional regulator|nr:hypothetical protein [Chromatiales bacterium]MCP4924412.1 4Fe-4S binding protein [Gammaproteobacteria bacterium]MDP7295856.1 4Fe-4S binding protein [Gammaproteobacteria bacterium]MDP7418741.1 4Fe-4S binding protein [Gammaproteobacteria bacterium]HJP38173.1 4Fe-4S binding protein [Gammaproteobacteria bacterium]
MNTTVNSTALPLIRIGMTAIIVAAFVYFWINGPLQERPPVFEFEEFVTGYTEPVRAGEEYIPPKFGVVGDKEKNPYHHVMTAKRDQRPTHGIIGDARTNPGLAPEVAERVFANAKLHAQNPDGVKLKTALDMYYAEERNTNGRVEQLYFENTGLNKRIKGYAGPIDIGMVVGADGRIRSVKHVFSMETTSYLNDIADDGFYEHFQGIPLDDKTYEVDIVSGASLTTEGIARSVSDLVSIARESPLEIYIDTNPAGFETVPVLPSTWVLEAALIVVLFIIAFSRLNRRSPQWSLAFGIVTIAYLGFFQNNSFTYATFTQPFLGISWSYILGVYAAIVLLSAIWDSNTYCRYICPYGNVQRLLLRIIPWHGKLKVSNRVLDLIRWAITITLIAGIVSGLPDWSSFELFPDLFGLEIFESKWFWLSLAAVLVSAYYPMLWCRMLCPTGAVLDGIAILARSNPAKQHAGRSGQDAAEQPAGA